MDLSDVELILDSLRAEGSDRADVEVKRASNGFPQNIASTLSAFGNAPGGGTLLFGVAESDGFDVVGVYDVAGCQQAVTGVARTALDPPLHVETHSLLIEGATVVVARVDEAPATSKPCRVRSSRHAYLRFYDGDFVLSEAEEQAFVANRAEPRFDQAAVPEASRTDLDPDLVEAYFRATSAGSETLSRFEREDVLFRTGVLVGVDRRPSLAGLLALGTYPQQWFPNAVIQASVAPLPGDPDGTRARDIRRFDGPLPTILESAVAWVRRNTGTRVRFGGDGSGRDEPEYPSEAVRELIANALVHRDLGPHALGAAVTLRLEANQLVVSNPGGLYGLSVERLGRTGVTSTRNSYLVRICQNVRTTGGARVVEAIASGIPTILASVQAAGMLPPRFHDQGIRFAVRLPNHALLGADDLAWLSRVAVGSSLSDVHRHALVALRRGNAWTNKSLRGAFPMDSRDATRLLLDLVDAGLAEAHGRRGGRVYQLASGIDATTGHRSIGGPSSNDPEQMVLDVLHDEPSTRSHVERVTGLTGRQVQYALQKLRERGEVVLDGTAGRRDSTYRVTEER